MQSTSLYKFTSATKSSDWRIIDDVVMGGRSNGDFKVNAEGYGEFYGNVSTANNGGFSSVRHYIKTTRLEQFSKFIIRLKGDGKSYQFRVKNDLARRYSYISTFDTNGDWQTIEIPFNSMFASFRGYLLDIPNYKGDTVEELAFLIGNKKNESFQLLIESISVE